MSSYGRIPTVGVMGSGVERHEELALPLGRWLAAQRVNLLTGGGSGVMAAVSEAFASVRERTGRVIGVLPDARQGYPNPWVEIAIRTHLPLSGSCGTELASRNHINVLSSDVIVVLPGSEGTLSEAKLALRYGRPISAYLNDPSDLPGLPGDIPVLCCFTDVQFFVLRVLGW